MSMLHQMNHHQSDSAPVPLVCMVEFPMEESPPMDVAKGKYVQLCLHQADVIISSLQHHARTWVDRCVTQPWCSAPCLRSICFKNTPTAFINMSVYWFFPLLPSTLTATTLLFPLPIQERPRSAVEQQLCSAESGRPRMSVEEQLERIRRHQQGALREKKKGLSIRGGSQENTPSRSHSFTKENHVRSLQVHLQINRVASWRQKKRKTAARQNGVNNIAFVLWSWSKMRRRDEVMSCDIQELEASLRQQEVVREQETPAEEIARLKEASLSDHLDMDREVRCCC